AHKDVPPAVVRQLDRPARPGVEVVVLGGGRTIAAPAARDESVAAAVHRDVLAVIEAVAAHAAGPNGTAAGVELPHEDVLAAGPARQRRRPEGDSPGVRPDHVGVAGAVHRHAISVGDAAATRATRRGPGDAAGGVELGHERLRRRVFPGDVHAARGAGGDARAEAATGLTNTAGEVRDPRDGP